VSREGVFTTGLQFDDITLERVFTPALQFDNAEKRVLHAASIYPRSSVSCAALTFRTRFTVFADRVAHSRAVVNTRPSVLSWVCFGDPSRP
jgi:hypothetical protein